MTLGHIETSDLSVLVKAGLIKSCKHQVTDINSLNHKEIFCFLEFQLEFRFSLTFSLASIPSNLHTKQIKVHSPGHHRQNLKGNTGSNILTSDWLINIKLK